MPLRKNVSYQVCKAFLNKSDYCDITKYPKLITNALFI